MDSPPASLPPPPPRPSVVSPARVYPGALRVYLRAAAFFSPLCVLLLFSKVFLFPKIREIWEMAEIEAPRANAVLNFASMLGTYGFFLFLGAILLVAVLEFFVPGWKRFRSGTMDLLIWLSMVAALVGITTLAVCACIAVPVVIGKQ